VLASVIYMGLIFAVVFIGVEVIGGDFIGYPDEGVLVDKNRTQDGFLGFARLRGESNGGSAVSHNDLSVR
jgi:hypothetical protein